MVSMVSSSSEFSSSSSMMHNEYSFRFLHLYPGTKFSSHQKHNPFAFRSSISLVLIGLEGLGLGLIVVLLSGGLLSVGNKAGWGGLNVVKVELEVGLLEIVGYTGLGVYW